MAGHSVPGAGLNTAQIQTNKMQSKIIKTMILVSLLYVALWSPGYIHNLLMNVSTIFVVGDAAFYTVMVLGYLYNCINPFIYATNFDPVNRVLVSLIPWKKNAQPLQSFEMS